MLKPKLKVCEGCGKSKMIWKQGRCKSCCASTFKSLEGGTKSLKASSFKKKYKKKTTGHKEFFIKQIEEFKPNPYSFESGKYVGEITGVNLAHIMPKEIYKSVAHEPLNIILLTWEEHTRFDELLGRHEFTKLEEEFKSWSKICNRLKKVVNLCEEYGNLRNALEKYLKI